MKKRSKLLLNYLLRGQLGYYYWVIRTYPLRRNFPRYNILSIEETIEVISKNKKSISRFGDGEFILMLGKRDIGFQKLNSEISVRLNEVLNSSLDAHLVCLTSALCNRKGYKRLSKAHWLHFINQYGAELSKKITNRKKTYGNALISRFYNHKIDKKNIPDIVTRLKQIWQDKDLLFIEGEFSRLGIGNDLFENSRSIERIICSSSDAFQNYASILAEATTFGKNKLIILALGPTATILAYDLAKSGYWAVDLGHIDIEYSWFIQNAKSRTPVKGKKSAEVSGEENFDLTETEAKAYQESIVSTIL